MTENINGVKATISTVIAAMTALWGWFGWLIILWIACTTLDYFTGSGAAVKNGQWNSSTSKEGIWHKVGCAVAILVAGAFDMLVGSILGNIPGITLPFNLEYTLLLCPLVLVWYILTELGSIIENAAAMGAPVPPFLLKALQKGKDAADQAGEKM